MKKLLILSLALFMVGGVAMAQLGLTAGLDFGIGRINAAEGENVGDTIFIRPGIAYGNSDLLDGLTIDAELGVVINTAEEVASNLDFALGVYYNLPLTPVSSLDFGLGTYLDVRLTDWPAFYGVYGPWGPRRAAGGEAAMMGMIFGMLEDLFEAAMEGDEDADFSGPSDAGDDRVTALMVPAVRYNHQIDGIGTAYGGLELPFDLAPDAFTYFGMDIILGIDTEFGFGFEVYIQNNIYQNKDKGHKDSVKFFTFLEFVPSYVYDFLYAEVAIGIPTVEDGVKMMGISITPEVRAEIPGVDGLLAYLNIPITGIGADGDDRVGIGIGLGARFSF